MTIATQGAPAADTKAKKPEAGASKPKTLKTPTGKSKVSKAKTASASPSHSTSSSAVKGNATKKNYGVTAAVEKAVRMIAREEIKKAQGKDPKKQVSTASKTLNAKAKKPAKSSVTKPSKKASPRAAFTNQIIDAIIAINPRARQASRQQVKTYLKANSIKSVANLDAMVNRALVRGYEQNIFLFPKGPAGRIMVPMASLSPKQRENVKRVKDEVKDL